ncbi:response regulator transcription factor [Ferroacidibacillus organovorans]|uniref:DNA-binding response regulator n=1 Tax=Ferroacidibacillus organovorans TaxID=1765683 RepID=A0A1V4ETD4_9BACL|nr:response regulator transcription factor [Ferroacidibacillus organovorans]OPG16024.1 DNA-binding response regulator [Ferroacidibacillus organovorans]
MQEHILVVDDEPEICMFLKEVLERVGYQVETAHCGDEAIARVKTGPQPDLIVLDVMMPRMNGFEVCEQLRRLVNCPILFLSARDQEADRVRGLIVGADDYLVKPFSVKELRARVHAHLRRETRARADDGPRLIRTGALSIDSQGGVVAVKGERVPFTQREFAILMFLVSHQGQVLSREQIYDTVWGMEAQGDAATVTEHIKKIRAKLAVFDTERSYISTVWGVGYKWERENGEFATRSESR